MSIYKREIDAQCCNQWMNGIRTINNQYPDDNREFTILAGPGIKIEPATAGIRITNDGDPNSFIAGDNIEFVDNGDGTVTIKLKDNQVRVGTTNLTGDVTITGNITQNGSAYETHAEQVFTTDDYIIMRDGATGALASGDYSGFQVKKYDSTNDGRLVIDNSGVARVGDVGDEQPLMTRDESTSLNNGDLLQWNGTSQKAVSANVNTSQIVRGTGDIGSDTKPIKIVNGVATPVTDDLALASAIASEANSITILEGSGSITYRKFGKMVIINLVNYTPIATGTRTIANVPYQQVGSCYGTVMEKNNHIPRLLAVEGGNLNLEVVAGDSLFIGQVVYMTT